MIALFQGLTRRGVGLVCVRNNPDRRWRHPRRVGEAWPGRPALGRFLDHLGKALLVAGVCQVSFYFGELYNLKVVADRREMFIRIVQGLGVTSLILGVLYFWFPSLVIGRGVFLIAARPGRRAGHRLATVLGMAGRARSGRASVC